MSNSIIYFPHYRLKNSQLLLDNVPGLKNYLTLSKFFQPDQTFIDRTENLTIPFNIKNITPIPSNIDQFNMSFDECIDSRMIELDRLYRETGRKFRLFYSGGIDSTSILSAFVKFYGIDNVADVLEITCTVDAIKENPWAWERIIRPAKFKLISSYSHPYCWDHDVTFIQGECADLIIPGPFTNPWLRYRSGKQTDVYPTFDTVVDFLMWKSNNYLNIKCTLEEAEYAADILINWAKKSTYNFETMISFTWWITFAGTWQTHKVRSVGFTNRTQLESDFFSKRYIQFYDSNDFQKWSIYTYGIQQEVTSMKNFKPYTKKYIIDSLKIPEYQAKGKFLSWEVINHNRKNLAFLTNTCEVKHNVDELVNYVNKDNSFK